MDKERRILWRILLAVALLAGTDAAHAISIPADPGSPGSFSDGFSFPVPTPGFLSVEVMFTDNKTLELPPGTTAIAVTGSGSNPVYQAAFLDAAGTVIPGTNFSGFVDGDAGDVDLVATTVFSGIQFIGDRDFDGVYLVGFVNNKPLVGVVPVPAAVWLFGSALGLLGWMRRKAS